jgi:hypothetical protein
MASLMRSQRSRIEPDECPQCDTALRVNDGLCVLCLLQAGLTEAEDSRSESLDTLLSEIE